MDANKTIEQAVKAFRSGRGDEGQELLDKVLRYQPGNPVAVQVLVTIQQHTPRALVPVETLKRVAEAQPQNPLVHELLANLLLATDPAAAEQSARAALRLKPSASGTVSLLGETLLAQRKFDAAADVFRTAIKLKPTNPFPVCRLSEVLRYAGRPAEAVDVLSNAIATIPTSPELHHALGSALSDLDRVPEAEGAYRKSIELRANYAPGYGSLGVLLHRSGRSVEAEQCLRDGIAALPNDALLHVGLGQILVEVGRLAEAEEMLRRALQIDSRHVAALVSLALLFWRDGRPGGAMQAAQAAAQLAPQSVDATFALGLALHAIGQSEQATPLLLRAWNAGRSPVAGSALLNNLNYVTKPPPDEIFKAHRAWGEAHADKLPAIQPHANARDATRRLKVGYVSGNFALDSIRCFIEPLLVAHDRSQVELFCYSSAAPQSVNERLRARADHWRDIPMQTDLAVIDMIHADGIDVLVDLAGHSNHNRLGVFARRAAPVQAAYLGYPNTTGMAAIRYRLTDARLDPLAPTEQLYTEQLVRLPQCAWCYQPPDEARAVSDLPALRAGHLTFGAFHRLTRITPASVELWCRALKALDQSRLILLSPGLHEPISEKYLRDLFKQFGVDGDRLVLNAAPPSSSGRLERYAEIDIALNTFPYPSVAGTCEAMWMGVPSINLAGASTASRIGPALLSSVGLQEFVASSAEQFVEIATRAAKNLDHLGEVRRTLRDRMTASPLLDAARCARDVEAAYRDMWRQWCEADPPVT